jgi:hypothetical protein
MPDSPVVFCRRDLADSNQTGENKNVPQCTIVCRSALTRPICLRGAKIDPGKTPVLSN